jgi:hypothetical protein
MMNSEGLYQRHDRATMDITWNVRSVQFVPDGTAKGNCRRRDARYALAFGLCHLPASPSEGVGFFLL